jgi:hypothetical protein
MKTRILPKSVYILTTQEERNYDRGGYDRDTILDSLNRRFGEPESLADDAFTEVRRRDGRVIGRFKGKP